MFQANQLDLNTEKPNFVKFTSKNSLHASLGLEYADKLIEETNSTKFLGMKINNHLTWKKHIDQILPKLDAEGFAVSKFFHALNIDVLRMLYFVYVHSIIKYRIIFWGKSTDV